MPLLVVAAASLVVAREILFYAAQLTAIAAIARTTAAPDLVSAAMHRAIQQSLLEIVDAGAFATRDKRGVCEATVGAEHLIFVDAGAPNSPTVTKAQGVVVLSWQPPVVLIGNSPARLHWDACFPANAGVSESPPVVRSDTKLQPAWARAE